MSNDSLRTTVKHNNLIRDIKNLDEHIEAKIVKLDGRMRYVKHKFEDVIYNFKNYSIAVIVLATLLTLIEAFTNMINIETIVPINLKHFVKFIPLILSSMVSLLAAIIKFNKYEEKIENITRATENGIVILAELKHVKEELYFCKDETTLIAIKNKYKKDVYKNYLESNINIEKQLVNSDYVKYLKVDINNDIRGKKIEFYKNKKMTDIGKKFSIHRNVVFSHTNSNDALRMAKSSQISTANSAESYSSPAINSISSILGNRRGRLHRQEPTIEEEMEIGNFTRPVAQGLFTSGPVTPGPVTPGPRPLSPIARPLSPSNININVTEVSSELKAIAVIQKKWRERKSNSGIEY